MTKRIQSGPNGFTLVEMLVATALILFIMVIISEAFVAGIDSLRQLKALGDMEEKLRVVATQMRRDLAADHFEGRRRLSDPQFWQQPPREGFFQIVQWDLSDRTEGHDALGIDSWKAFNHRLHFTVKLRGNQQERFFTAPIPDAASPLLTQPTNFFSQPPDGRFQDSGNYSSPWAEIAYFLVPTGTNTGSASVPLFTLYRSQLLIVPDNRAVSWSPDHRVPHIAGAGGTYAAYQGFSCQPNGRFLFFNNPSDLASGNRPLDGDLAIPIINPSSAVSPNIVSRSSVMVTDVISFDVQVLKADPGTVGPRAGTADFSDLPRTLGSNGFPAIFDTKAPPRLSTGSVYYYGHPQSVGNPNDPMSRDVFNILAVQITVRIWDLKTEQTRQITIVQDL